MNVKTVTRWANDGLIPYIRLPGGHRRYKRTDIEEMVEYGYQSARKR